MQNELKSPGLLQRRLSIDCAISVLKTDRKYRYFFLCFLKYVYHDMGLTWPVIVCFIRHGSTSLTCCWKMPYKPLHMPWWRCHLGTGVTLHRRRSRRPALCTHMDPRHATCSHITELLTIVPLWCLSGPCLNIKTVLSTYGDFHVKDKTAVRTSYL